MLGNSDLDDIFPVPGFRRLAEKVEKVYELYGAGNKFMVYETLGKHEDTPELRLGEYRWMNRWMTRADAAIAEEKFERLGPQDLRVLDKTPEDQLNTTIQDLFVKPANIELPRSPDVVRSWWPGAKAKLQAALGEKVFH